MISGKIPPPPPPPGSPKPPAAPAARPPLPPPPPGPLLRDVAVQAELKELQRHVSAGRRRSAWLLGGALATVVLGAVCWAGYYAASVLTYAELDDALEITRYAADPDRLILGYRPLSAGTIAFRRGDADRETELLDRVAPDAVGKPQTFLWRVPKVQPGDAIQVTRLAGWSLETTELRVPELSASPAESGFVASSGSALGNAVVAGRVLNAVNKQPVPDVQVRIAGTRLSTRTDADGRFRLTGAPSGLRRIEISAKGFTEDVIERDLTPEHETEIPAVAISPGMEKGQIRAVLTWGKEAKDLDAHLEGPLPDAKRFHVYYHEQGDLKSKEFVRLDVDDQDGGGPETVTVLGVLPGVYRYFVHDYTNRDNPAANEMARSQAEVRLYQGGQTYRFRAGHDAAGNLWDVCTIEVTPQGAVVKKVDQYQGVNASSLNLYAKRTKGGREQWIGNYGGSAVSEKAVTDGLDWLVRHQAADGSWSNKNLGPGAETLCTRTEPCFGTGEVCEMAHTGLALLALQAGGHYYFNRQTHCDSVRKGLDWMVSHQRPDGGLVGSLSQGNNFHQTYMYEHGIAAFALADACAAAAALGEPRQERYYNAMEKAVEFIYRHQHNDGGWRYTPNPNAASDTSVTGWPVLALKSAKEAGVPLRDEAVEKVRAYFRAREAGREGRTGYTSPHAYHTDATTGVGMLARQFLLKEPDAPLIRDAADYLAKAAETSWKDRSPAERNRDYYMWYNCTLGMFQAGGENWKRWNSVVRDTIVNLQRHGGCPDGSWDPSDRWGGRGGRIYSTALAILTLEVYYRYTAPSEFNPDEFELHSTTTKRDGAPLTPDVRGQ